MYNRFCIERKLNSQSFQRPNTNRQTKNTNQTMYCTMYVIGKSLLQGSRPGMQKCMQMLTTSFNCYHLT